jgi:hypothetical protein
LGLIRGVIFVIGWILCGKVSRILTNVLAPISIVFSSFTLIDVNSRYAFLEIVQRLEWLSSTEISRFQSHLWSLGSQINSSTCRHASPQNTTCKTNERMLPHNHT